jgi:LPXTG-motif cell wall-anchored protein
MSWLAAISRWESPASAVVRCRQRAFAVLIMAAAVVLMWQSVAAAEPSGSPTAPGSAAPSGSPTPSGSATPSAPTTGSRAASTFPPGGAGTLTVNQYCEESRPATNIVVHNGLDQDAHLSIREAEVGQVLEHFVIPADTTQTLVWMWEAPPLPLVLVNDDTQHTLADVTLCYQVFDVAATITAGSSYTSADTCPGGISRKPRHGTVRTVDRTYGGTAIIYTPASGFVGTDSFEYNCIPGFLTTVRFHITVRPRTATAAPLRRAAPPPAAALPATGTSGVLGQIGAGFVLVFAGGTASWLARRRRGSAVRGADRAARG